jgi:ribosomal protein S18 acetylase RimI-like enzyme
MTLRMKSSEAAALARASDCVTAPLELVSRRIEGAWVDSTRTAPGYWHGNRLVLDAPPRASEMTAWLDRYSTLFAWRRSAYPAVITWYEQLGADSAQGIEVERAVVLLASGVDIGPIGTDDVRFVRLTNDEQWAKLLAADEAENPHLGAFVRWRTRSFRALTQSGRGHWYALVNASGDIVASAGGFSHDGVARFASVFTVSAYQRRGYARRLVCEIARILRRDADAVVIVAERDSPAESLYRSVGFTPFIGVASMVSAGRAWG